MTNRPKKAVRKYRYKKGYKKRYKKRIFSSANCESFAKKYGNIFKIKSKQKLFKDNTKQVSKVKLLKFKSKKKLCPTCITNMYTPPNKECWLCRGGEYTQKTIEFV